METKFKKGEIVHLDYIKPFLDKDGVIKEVVIRDGNWKFKEKYLVEVEYKFLGLFKRKVRKWFTGTDFICKKEY